MKLYITVALIFFFFNLRAQDRCEGFVVTIENDTLHSYFNLSFNKPKKKIETFIGSKDVCFFVPKLNKELTKHARFIKYFEFKQEGITHKYFTVPVPSIGKKTLPFFGKLSVDGQYQLIEVCYDANVQGRWLNTQEPTSPYVFKSYDIIRGNYTYYYLRNKKNEFIMVKRIVKNRSRNKFSFNCPEVEKRILNKYYKKSNRNDIVKDLNDLCPD